MNPQQIQPQSPADIQPISENPSSFSPVPDSPPEVGGVESPSVQGELSQDQMRGNLQEMMSKMEALNQQNKAELSDFQGSKKKNVEDAIQKLFELFQQNGIDPSNVEEVKAFLEKIKTTNPELSSMVENAIITILSKIEQIGNQEEGVEGTMPIPQDNMNITNNEQPGQNI
jgi:hypothetical protein